ncbi:response regulator transcription factor [Arthrobacter sp. GMC3]|uniref:response regulator n=1 Tax=Arthrobacter sp. GMC3 TaxID=2058894 RepID=UPI0015E4509C|nr:response regulator transcription factor [Arthrobacter sp. GMC3]
MREPTMDYQSRETNALTVGGQGGETATTILLVEDHAIMRLGLRTVLGAQPDMRIVGEASTGPQTLAAVAAHNPDLVIIPLRLGGELRGVELCREIKGGLNAPLVMIYTSYNSPQDSSSAYLSGADSFLHKGERASRLLDTVRATAAGKKVWIVGSENTAQIEFLEGQVANSKITSREREILGFMLQRFTNAEIANELFIEVPTVKSHVSSILAKLGIRSRLDLF